MVGAADTGAESEKSSREEARQIRHTERSESRELPANYNPFSHTYSATSLHATPGQNQYIYIICTTYIGKCATLTCGGSRSGSDRGRARGSEGEGRQRSDELLVLHRHHDGLPHLTHTNTHTGTPLHYHNHSYISPTPLTNSHSHSNSHSHPVGNSTRPYPPRTYTSIDTRIVYSRAIECTHLYNPFSPQSPLASSWGRSAYLNLSGAHEDLGQISLLGGVEGDRGLVRLHLHSRHRRYSS